MFLWSRWRPFRRSVLEIQLQLKPLELGHSRPVEVFQSGNQQCELCEHGCMKPQRAARSPETNTPSMKNSFNM